MTDEKLDKLARIVARLKKQVLDEADSLTAKAILGGWLLHLECIARGDLSGAAWQLQVIAWPDVCLYAAQAEASL